MPEFYTLRDANEKLPELTRLLHLMQAQGQQLAELRGRAADVKKKVSSNGDHNPSEDILLTQAEKGLEDALDVAVEKLQDWNILLKDLERGLVDFPSLREGRTVFLCWELGESEVAHWHETTTGYDDRRPVDEWTA